MTRAVVTLGIVIAITYAVRTFAPGAEALSPGVTLAIGFLLIAAIQSGHIAGRLRLPHLSGFILAGLICGPEVLGLISARSLASLALVKGVSVGLIALLAGCELNLKRLRPRLRAVATYGGVALVCAGVLLFALFFFVTSVLPVTKELGAVERMTIALVCANVLCAFSPPVVIGIITEAGAAGSLSDLWISIAVLADLVIVVTFSMTNAIARIVFPREESAAHLQELLLHVFGSIGAGLIVGIILVWYVRVVGRRVGLFVFMLLFVVAEAGSTVHLNPLLAGLAAGLFLENVTPIGGAYIAEASEPAVMPIYAIFFAVIGAEVRLGAFMHVAPFAVAAALTRACGLFGGTRLAGRFLHAERKEMLLVPYGMLPQAGIALALATLVLTSFAPWGPVIGTVLLGSIVVNEMIGPVLLRVAVDRSGEASAREDLTLTKHADEEETALF